MLLAEEGCRGGCRGERPGLPSERHSRLQQTYHRAQLSLSAKLGARLGKRLRKGTPKAEKRGGGENSSTAEQISLPCSSWKSPGWSRYSLQPAEVPTAEHKDIPEGTAARGEPTAEQKKDVRWKEWLRDIPVH